MHVDEVDVGAEVELGAAQLAEREHGEARDPAGGPTGLEAGAVAGGDLERDLHEAVGQRRQRGEGARDRRQPQQVADRDPQDLAPAQEPERGAGAVAVAGCGEAARLARHARGARSAPEHPGAREPARPLGMPDHLLGEERRPAEGPEQGLGRGGTASHELRERDAAVAAHETLEADERGVRVRQPRERTQQRKQPCADERADAWVGCEQPQLSRRALGRSEAAAAQPRERLLARSVLEEPLGRSHAAILRLVFHPAPAASGAPARPRRAV